GCEGVAAIAAPTCDSTGDLNPLNGNLHLARGGPDGGLDIVPVALDHCPGGLGGLRGGLAPAPAAGTATVSRRSEAHGGRKSINNKSLSHGDRARSRLPSRRPQMDRQPDDLPYALV